ncbi:hypothetical protein Ppa06_67500 [Planomonospora parontospora subsp. parontospora]|uniref:Transcription regulator PadR N-terminal domain-containing protein n=2 Tax=Planomonospora parontospora TaxID=58119 RepID=A0AA37BPG1_9ACTN|nr:PadR family transcriptional regulator [Planomonospora parontospora]GGK99398.1 hypothetical protein GCM10010126_68700 [Planomonospora parontospora]GII12952.1 hypothetical protein Ppa06_67500 [Planomonospora parontospora subsp. parontospora]
MTAPTLDVLEVLVRALQEGEELYGWAIIKSTGRAGPTVYKVLDRLEAAKMIKGRWEVLPEGEPGPPRRFYTLTGEGALAARELLAERRPSAFQPRPAFGFAPLAWLSMLLPGGTR